MKKLLVILLTVALLFCTACSGANEPQSSMDTLENGSRILTTESGTTVFPSAFPASFDYNGKSLSVSSVTVYQGRSDSSYAYTLFAVVALDVSSLEDDELHWLRESDLDVSIYLTSEDNSYDFDRMNPLGNLLITDRGELCYVLTSSFFKENRYPFNGEEITVALRAEIAETYEYVKSDGSKSNQNKTSTLQYTMTLPAEIPAPEEIESPLYGYVSEWLYDEAGFYANMIE